MNKLALLECEVARVKAENIELQKENFALVKMAARYQQEALSKSTVSDFIERMKQAPV